MSEQVRNQNVGFLMTRLILSSFDRNPLCENLGVFGVSDLPAQRLELAVAYKLMVLYAPWITSHLQPQVLRDREIVGILTSLSGQRPEIIKSNTLGNTTVCYLRTSLTKINMGIRPLGSVIKPKFQTNGDSTSNQNFRQNVKETAQAHCALVLNGKNELEVP